MQQGYCHPLSPNGRTSVVESPPWHYGADILFVSFRADEAEVRKLLPEPLQPGKDPGLAFAWIADIISCGADPDLIYKHPESTQYKEGLLAVSCEFKGTPGWLYPYVWVDQDFSLMRGWFLGFPKKSAKVFMTRIHEQNPILPQLGVGTSISGFVERYGTRPMAASLAITGRADREELPNIGNTYNIRHFPNVPGSTTPSIYDIVNIQPKNSRFGDIWKGDATLTFGGADDEEVRALQPKEIIAGYYYQVGWSNDIDATVVHTFL